MQKLNEHPWFPIDNLKKNEWSPMEKVKTLKHWYLQRNISNNRAKNHLFNVQREHFLQESFEDSRTTKELLDARRVNLRSEADSWIFFSMKNKNWLIEKYRNCGQDMQTKCDFRTTIGISSKMIFHCQAKIWWIGHTHQLLAGNQATTKPGGCSDGSFKTQQIFNTYNYSGISLMMTENTTSTNKAWEFHVRHVGLHWPNMDRI